MHSSTKLTLRLDKQLIIFAKRYSAEHGKSISQIVAEYFNLLGESASEKKAAIPPITRSLVGIMGDSKLREKDYKKYLEDKFL